MSEATTLSTEPQPQQPILMQLTQQIWFLSVPNDFVGHIVVELTGSRPGQNSSTCQSGTQISVLSIWSLGSGVVSHVPCLGDDLRNPDS